MIFPNRHRNHEIEELSERFFKNFIPISWVVNAFKLDYGTDYNCEIVKGGGVTGMNFSIQLKGKETEINKNDITVSNIKRTTINRWLNRLEPTMIIVYLIDENEAYWIWFENNTVDLTSDNSSFTIKLSRKNKLSQINWQNVSEFIEKIFSKKDLLYQLPSKNDNSELAWKLYFDKKFEEALPRFKELSNVTTDGLIFNAIAVCEYRLFHYQEALININRALETHDDEILYLNKAAILTEQGALNNDFRKIEASIKIYENIILNGTNSDSVYYNYASALTKLKEYNKALIQFKQAIFLNPNKPEIWNNLGNVYLNLGHHIAEIECYNKALALNPNFPEALFSKGSTLFRFFGEIDKGLELMLKTTELSKRYEFDFPYLFFWISEAYLTKFNFEQASKWNKKGLDIFPTDDYLLKQKVQIEDKLMAYKNLKYED